MLVADDSPTFLSALVDALTRPGDVTVVATAGDGREAVELFTQLALDLAILDVGMPRMNGLQAAAEMRRLSPGVRIVLISIHSDRQLEAECLRHGADSFVPKIAMRKRLRPEIERLFPQVAVAGYRRKEALS